MLVRRVNFCKAGFLAAASGLMFAPTASAEDIRVPPDQVRVITFNTPAKTVFVGNPAIADITVIDSTHVFLLGKNFGTTNIIALDAAGHEFVNQQVQVIVLDQSGTMVTVQRGAAQNTMSCTAERCVPIVNPGDEKVDTISGQFQRREDVATKAAASGGSGSTGGAGAQQ